jgi:hypothetical protein
MVLGFLLLSKALSNGAHAASKPCAATAGFPLINQLDLLNGVTET